MSEPILDVRGVEKSYRTTKAVSGVSFSVRRGEIFGLLGPNGAGKSTLIRIILDIQKPDAGAVDVFGHPLTRGDLDRIGYLPEERGLYKKRRVIQVLRYLGQLKGLGPKEAVASAERWLARVGMSGVRDAKVETLSKGNQQKIQLVGTLLGDPPLLVWDEPFSGLDPVNANQVRDLLLALRDEGTTVILSTHLMAQAEAICDRVALISQGQLVLHGTVDEARQRYGSAAVDLVTDAPLDAWGLDVESRDGDRWRVCDEAPGALARRVVQEGYRLDALEPHRLTLEEIFLRAVQS